MKRIVIFASGSGSNAENLIQFFNQKKEVAVVQVLTNNPHAQVINRCNRLKISCLCFNRTAFYGTKTNIRFESLVELANYIQQNHAFQYPSRGRHEC